MTAVRLVACVVGLMLAAPPGAAGQNGTRPADVAVYPLTAADSTQARQRFLSDSCTGVIALRLTADSLRVLRRPPPLRELRRTKGATYAVLGTLAQDSGKYQVELQLRDVAGDAELRSYFGNLDVNPCKMPAAAAARIATVVKQLQREARRQ